MCMQPIVVTDYPDVPFMIVAVGKDKWILESHEFDEMMASVEETLLEKQVEGAGEKEQSGKGSENRSI